MKQILRSKIHQAIVTDTNPYYEGSMFLDYELMEKSWISSGEKVEITNIRNWERWSTYAVAVETQERLVSVNWWAARLAEKWDKLIIMAYEITQEKIITPTIVVLDDENSIKNIKNTL